MPADCSAPQFEFGVVEGRRVVAAFDGGAVTSDAGALLLGAADKAIGLIERFAGCFSDGRSQQRIEHEITTLVGQRVFGLALGYEDVLDHDQLRHDPAMAILAGKLAAQRPDCAPLAGKSTLNRLEHAPAGGLPATTRSATTRRRSSACSSSCSSTLIVGHQPRSLSISMPPTIPCTATRRVGSFTATMIAGAICRFMCSAAGTCWQPGSGARTSTLRLARSRRSSALSGQIRARWPRVKILLRADSGFARDGLMSWCERNRVDYVFGLARNARLEAEIAGELAVAEVESRAAGSATRRFKELWWTTLDSWSRQRRVVAKAEWTHGGPNPRFVVTSLGSATCDARRLYEDIYCARGEMENRIKECQLDLFADRTSAATMKANQLRLWFASMAYVLLCALRRIGLRHTQFATATCGTIRQRLLKIGALVRISCRRIKLAMASAFPCRQEYALAHLRLARAAF